MIYRDMVTLHKTRDTLTPAERNNAFVLLGLMIIGMMLDNTHE